MITDVLREHPITRAPTPKLYLRLCSRSIRNPESPCPNQNNLRVPKASDNPEHPCPHLTDARVPRARDYLSIHAQTKITFPFLEHPMRIHAQTMITFPSQWYPITRAFYTIHNHICFIQKSLCEIAMHQEYAKYFDKRNICTQHAHKYFKLKSSGLQFNQIRREEEYPYIYIYTKLNHSINTIKQSQYTETQCFGAHGLHSILRRVNPFL